MPTLSEVSVAIVDCEHKTAPSSPTGYPSIRTTDLNNGRIDLAKANRVERQVYEEWTRRRKPQPGDIILAREAPVGEVGLVPGDARVCLGQRTVLISPDREQVAPRYLLYLMLTPEVREAMAAQSAGSTVPHLNMSAIRELQLPELPPLRQQERTAEALGALDDKIELNRKMNRTLEEIAQTLFRAWFVDFEGETDLVDSELGPVPRGWDVAPIGDLVKTLGGGTPSTKNPRYWEEGEIHWTTPRDLSGVEVPVLIETARMITEEGLDRISSGLLPIGTVLLSSRAPVGYTAIAQVPLAVNQGYIAIPPGGQLSSYYVLFWLRENMKKIKGRAGGTTFKEISKRSFRPILAVKPPSELQQSFDAVVGPLFERIVVNVRQSRTLADLRDTLLPKLISGEIRVPEAADLVDDAAEAPIEESG